MTKKYKVTFFDMIKKMLLKKLPIETIVDITNFSKEDILKIAEKI